MSVTLSLDSITLSWWSVRSKSILEAEKHIRNFAFWYFVVSRKFYESQFFLVTKMYHIVIKKKNLNCPWHTSKQRRFRTLFYNNATESVWKIFYDKCFIYLKRQHLQFKSVMYIPVLIQVFPGLNGSSVWWGGGTQMSVVSFQLDFRRFVSYQWNDC